MLIVLPAHPMLNASSGQEAPWSWREDILWDDDLLYCDPTRQEIGSFQVGEIVYRTVRPLRATYEPPLYDCPGRFVAAGLELTFVGQGSSLDKAREDWELQIDQAIQQLLATQEFERTEEQTRQWHLLSRFFDLNEIRYSQPLRIRAYGQLTSAYPRPIRVRWIDGTKNTLSRDQISHEMVAFRVGQPFEAVVERDPRSWKLLRIEAAFPTSGLPAVSEDEANELLRDVPSAADLPALDWD